MKCSLKDGLINILLLICITPTEGIDFPPFLHKSSVLDKSMNLQKFRASINRLQDLDSFPDSGDNRLHRIVKKQMASCDCRDTRKSKRSVVDSYGKPGAGDSAEVKPKDDDEAENAGNHLRVLKIRNTDSTDSMGSFFKKLKEFAKEKDLLFLKRAKKNDPPNKGLKGHQSKLEADTNDSKEMLKGKDKLKGEKPQKYSEGNPWLAKECSRFPDVSDNRYYYECESHPYGCLKLKHKRCPQGQYFSSKYQRCLQIEVPQTPETPEMPEMPEMPEGSCRQKKSSDSWELLPKTFDLPVSSPEEPEPANEWLDATQGANQKIPWEFKPKKKPELKIYHLRGKRKLDGTLRGQIMRSRHLRAGSGPWHAEKPVHGIVKKHGTRHHLPRSYVIRVNKKEDEDQITENDENDNDEEDEETEEEDEDEEADDEDEDSEEEDPKEVIEEKPTARESFRDLLKSAKAAVTNRARFQDPVEMAARGVQSGPSKATASLKSKKSNDALEKGKKVLIDANIKVDSTIGSVLKSLLKTKRKDKEETNGLADDYADAPTALRSRDQMDVEGSALYEHLMRNNPRVKRYFLANCAQRGN